MPPGDVEVAAEIGVETTTTGAAAFEPLLAGTADRHGALLLLHARLESRAGAGSLRLLRLDGTAEPSEIEVTADRSHIDLLSSAAATLDAEGTPVVAWRDFETGPGGGAETWFTRVAWVRGTSVERAAVLHTTDAAVNPVPGIGLAALGNRMVAAAARPDAVLLADTDDGFDLELPAETRVTRMVGAASLTDRALVVVWAERVGDESSVVAAIVASEPASVAHRETVFAPAPFSDGRPALSVTADGIWVARFERDLGSLADSYLRVARLQGQLLRVEPDRWLTGWGGRAPVGLGIASWAGATWAFARLADARYGGLLSLVAHPLTGPPCGGPVGEAVGTWTWAPGAFDDLVVVGTDGPAYVAVSGVGTDSSAAVYVLQAPSD